MGVFMFNVRIKDFGESLQVQVFEKYISEKDTFDSETGEIKEKIRNDGKIDIFNPFTNEIERVKVIDDEKEKRMLINNYNRAKSVIYDIARSNTWDWFLTFTFSKNNVDRYDFDLCSRKIASWLHNVKKRKCSDMKYLLVPEQHKDGAWHFHGLLSNCGKLEFIPSGYKDSSGRVIYNLESYKLGFTTATKVSDSIKASAYLCKYVTKELVNSTKGKHRYWASKNCNRPIVTHYMMEGGLSAVLKELGSYKQLKQLDTPFNRITYIEM